MGTSTKPAPQVLISGASGLIGRALQADFRSTGTPFATLVRRPAPESASANAPAYLWDPYRFEFREEMRGLNGVRAAIHLSGENLTSGRWTAARKQRFRDSRIATTRSLVKLLRGLDQPPEVLLCASGANYYGSRGDEVLDESGTPGEGFLAEICRDWEAAADEAKTFGVRVVHLRFGLVLTAQGGALPKMLPVFRLGLGGKLGSGRQWASWIAMDDAVRAIRFCMDHRQIDGPVNMVGNPVTNAEFTAALAARLHRPALMTAPSFALRIVLGEMADEALLASIRAIPSKLLQAGFTFAHPTLPEALQKILPNRS